MRKDTTNILESGELKDLIFKYSVEFMTGKKDRLKNYKKVDNYVSGFIVNGEDFKEFLAKAEREGLNIKEIKEEEQNIKDLIKTEIAGLYWGKREEMIVSLKGDSQFQEALGYLNKANKVLELYKKNFKL